MYRIGSKTIKETCIYTIKHSDDLNEKILTGGYAKFIENKIWSTGEILLNEAKSEDKKLIIIFSPAESTAYLHSWGILTDIQLIKSTKSYTEYSVKNLVKFNKKIGKTKLHLFKTGKNIDENFIRPYAICKTPFEVIDKEISINANEETLDTYSVELSEVEKVESLIATANERMKKISPKKIERIIRTSIRNDSKIITLLKEKYNYKCQFPGCGITIKKSDGNFYIEVAHINPVASGGKSVIGNLLVLCPNHHKEFDYGNLVIEEQDSYKIKGILNDQNFEISMV